MRQLIVSEPGKVEWADAVAPRLAGPGSALVRPIAAATCDFDHLLVSGATGFPLPVALGHEFVAEVVEVGSAVTRVRAGDRVVVPFQISCGTCAACRRGRTSSCENVPWLSCYGLGDGAGGWGSAFSDLVRVPYADAMLVPLPDGVEPAEAAAVGCNVVDAYRCVAPGLEEEPGAAVLVLSGAFANIALFAVAIARALGAPRVDFFDRDPAVREWAGLLGANVVDSPERIESGAYPITVDATMDPSLLATAIRATAPSGTCTLSAMYPGETTPVPLMDAFQRCLTLRTGQPHARALLDPVLGLVSSGRLRPSAITRGLLDWGDAPEAFRHGRGKFVCTRA
jgi:alcohol dehydrogenase